MKGLHLTAYVIGTSLALGALAGCGGGSQSYAPGGAPRISSNGTPFARASAAVLTNRAASWMLPEAAKSKALLYVSDYSGDKNEVDVFSYPADKFVGALTTDMLNPDGLCTDKKNDVWVVNNTPNADDLVEFKHGGTTPIATFVDPGESAISCAIDPTTGNLAVTSGGNISGGTGAVAIYAHAKGTPQIITDPQMFAVYWCGYDDKGNLFVDGQPTSDGFGFQLAELPKGKKTLVNIKLTGGTINFPGQVQWDGKYLLIGDQEAQASGMPESSAIYETTGAGGKIVKKIMLKGSSDFSQFLVTGATIVGPNSLGGSLAGGDVLFYKYPAGGTPAKKLSYSFDYPIGLTISQ
ncbi:MAG TPA: hypothetical protein VIX83_13870 [Candidatus Cybelea sp.]